jgi:DNA helicase II / ATP-dependent DNA helicase PcrA
VIKLLKYSCIRFQEEIDANTINELRLILKNGSKVYFFTFDPKELILNDYFLQQANEKQLLLVYEIRFNEELRGKFEYFNGDVPDEILNLLSKYAPLFNKAQYLIEHAPLNQNIIVSAGAGTGKTTVMINRIIFMKYMNPSLKFSDLALITFTKKAALNIRERLVEKLKFYFKFTNNSLFLRWVQEIKLMEIGTIHSFAYTLLKENQSQIFEGTNLPISQFKYRRKKIIEEVIDEFHEKYPQEFSRFKYIEQYKVIQTVEAIIDQINNFSISLKGLKELDFGNSDDFSHFFFEYIVKNTISRLDHYKNKNEYLDVNDLITKLEVLMIKNSQTSLPFKYIFIDEFQDTDRKQTEFFSYLANNFPLHLFVVGDVKQSIYRFRGADYTAFDQLKMRTKIDAEFYLQLNYRSDSALINQFNELFSQWPRLVQTFQYNKEDYLIPGKEAQENTVDKPIKNINFNTKHGFIQFLRNLEGTDTAILVRTNKEVNELAYLCEKNRIFFTAEQDGDFYRSLPVREFYQLILRYTHPTLWKNRYLLHLSSYGERTLEVGDVINQFSPNRININGLDRVDTRLEKYENQFLYKGVFEVFEEIINEINPAQVYAERFLHDRFAQNQEEKEKSIEYAKVLYKEYQLNLNQLIYLLKKDLQDTVPTLNHIEKALRIKMQTDKSMSRVKLNDQKNQRITIMTVHKSKGLEFDFVFIPNTKREFHTFTKTDIIIADSNIGYKTIITNNKAFTNNHYKDLKKINRAEDVGEETRLLYVAITRAKKKVFLDTPLNSNNHTVRNWGDLLATNYTSYHQTENKTIF